MTYLFKGQIQRYYFDLYGFGYNFKAVKKDGEGYVLTDYDVKNEERRELYELINVYEGNKNKLGEDYYALSASKLRNMSADKTIETRRAIYGYFRNDIKAKSKDILWTTIKGENDRIRKELSGKGYARSFLQCNARATNQFQDRWALAYVFNRFMNPIERAFFEDNGVTVDQDALAVSDLLQWIYRSRIRNGQPVELYLPSSRMRGLLKAWAENEI